MRAILIDPFTKTVEETDVGRDYRQIYEKIGQDCFTSIKLTDRDVVYLDDEGLLRGPDQRYFTLGDYPQPLGGRGLVLGVDYAGESVSASVSERSLRERVSWCRPDLRFDGFEEQSGVRTHPILGKVDYFERVAVFTAGGERWRASDGR